MAKVVPNSVMSLNVGRTSPTIRMLRVVVVVALLYASQTGTNAFVPCSSQPPMAITHASPHDVVLHLSPMSRKSNNEPSSSSSTTTTFVPPTMDATNENSGTNSKQTISSSFSTFWPNIIGDASLSRTLCSGALALNLALGIMINMSGCSIFSPQPAFAAEAPRVVGQIQGSGLLFKDALTIESFEDPKVQGVTLYISNFQRPLTERLSSAKKFFSDPSTASVACAKTSKTVAIADNIAKGLAGEEVFEESKSLLFKSLRVQRIYDEDRKTVVYVSFNTRLDKNDDSNKSRFQNSLCAVNLED